MMTITFTIVLLIVSIITIRKIFWKDEVRYRILEIRKGEDSIFKCQRTGHILYNRWRCLREYPYWDELDSEPVIRDTYKAASDYIEMEKAEQENRKLKIVKISHEL